MAVEADNWVFYAVELTSGEVLIDLPLVDFSGEVSLTIGTMGAKCPILDLDSAQRQAIIESTIPGRYSILALHQGKVAGEWIIWQRTRANDLAGIELAGSETISLLDRRVTPTRSWTQTEQLDIARDLILTGFGPSPKGNGAVALSFGTYSASGQKRDRAYTLADGTIGGRLKELGAVINGFDYYIQPEWVEAVGQPVKVQRTAYLKYPRAGGDYDIMLENATLIDFQLTEDATSLASTCYAIGEDGLISTYEDDALIMAERLPYLEKSGSFTSVSVQATLDGHARAMWDDAQDAMLPGDLNVLANRSPGIGDWSLGDIVTLVLDESVNFPFGLRVDVRVIGWHFQQVSSGPETLILNVAQEGPVGDYSGNPLAVW